MKLLQLSLLALSSMLIMSCGGGGTSDKAVTGKVVDGYVQGARVYIVPIGDATSTGALFQSDSTSDSGGNFRFGKAGGFVQANSGSVKLYKLLCEGGINTATGAALPAGAYSAPLGSAVITPLTTLVMASAARIAGSGALTQAIIDQATAQIAGLGGIDAGQASSAVFGTDPVTDAGSNAGAAKALALEIMVAQLTSRNVASFDSLATSLTTGAAPQNLVALALAAALPGSNNDIKAQIIASATLNSINQVTTATQAQAQPPTGSAAALIMTQTEAQVNTSLSSVLAGVDSSTVVSDAVILVTNAVSSAVSTGSTDKSTQAADLQNATARNYLVQMASDNGIASLLGIDLMSLPAGALAKGISGAAAKFSGKSVSKSVASSTNPCSEVGIASATASCSDIFGADFCAGAGSGFSASVACSGGLPSSVSVTLSSFSVPAVGTTLSGNIAITPSTMTFTGVSNGSSTFNGSAEYSAGANGSMEFAVRQMTVTSPVWSSLSLDELAHLSLATGMPDGKNRMNVYLSGSGTRAGSSGAVKLSLAYGQVQDAAKTAAGAMFTRGVGTTLNGMLSKGVDTVKFSGFGMSETLFYAAAGDDNYQYKLSSFLSGSKVATSKFGYAFFNGTDLRFDFDPLLGPVYQSGTLTLTAQ